MLKTIKYSPWGKIQTSKVIADGIEKVSTSSHGGFKLNRKRNAGVHPLWRRAGGWYEEDCEWAIVVLTYPILFPQAVPGAVITAKDWFPYEYEGIYNTLVGEEESSVKRLDNFNKANANNWIVTAAYGPWKENVPQGMVGVVATLGGKPEGAKRFFLVPKVDYTYPNFIVDLNRYQEVEKF